jgi:hypothetical protein
MWGTISCLCLPGGGYEESERIAEATWGGACMTDKSRSLAAASEDSSPTRPYQRPNLCLMRLVRMPWSLTLKGRLIETSLCPRTSPSLGGGE